MNNPSGFEIRPEQRQSWLSIAMVWAGGMICVPCLMVGGVLSGGGLSIAQIIASILIGYGLICAYMIFIGMAACDTGLPVSVLAEGALGRKGARYIISTLLAIACIGWFGIQSVSYTHLDVYKRQEVLRRAFPRPPSPCMHPPGRP